MLNIEPLEHVEFTFGEDDIKEEQHQHDFLNLVMSAVIFLLLVGGGLFFYFLAMAFLDWNDLMDGIKFLGMVVLMFFAWVYQIDIINFIFDIT